MKKTARKILLVIFTAVFLISAASLFCYYRDGKNSDTLYKNIYESCVVTAEENDIIKNLKAVNSDTAAFLRISGIGVMYPVVQCDNNEKYLKINFNGEKDKDGCLFLDFNNSVDFTDGNSIIYGHNMRNGNMFARLVKLADADAYEQNRIFYLDTPDGENRYEIVSVCYADSADGKIYSTDFETTEEKEEYINYILSASIIKTGVKPQPDDRFLTLSTCSYKDRNRFAVIARKIS